MLAFLLVLSYRGSVSLEEHIGQLILRGDPPLLCGTVRARLNYRAKRHMAPKKQPRVTLSSSSQGCGPALVRSGSFSLKARSLEAT